MRSSELAVPIITGVILAIFVCKQMRNKENFPYKTQDIKNLGSWASPDVRNYTVHDCGTTVEKYKIAPDSCDYQTWCDPAVERYSFAMQAITSPNKYYTIVQNHFRQIANEGKKSLKDRPNITDQNYIESNQIDDENINKANIIIYNQQEVLDHITSKFNNCCSDLKLFYKNNPINESFIITEPIFESFIGTKNNNILFHKVVVSAFNLGRYITNTFVIHAYQEKISKSASNIYYVRFEFANNLNCSAFNKDNCLTPGYNVGINNEPLDVLLNINNNPEPQGINWSRINSTTDSTYDTSGDFSFTGEVNIQDSGPPGLQNLIKEMKVQVDKGLFIPDGDII